MSFKAYKAFNSDQTCLGFKYDEGQTYEMAVTPILCQRGFHFCKDLVLTLQYYPIDNHINENLYAEVEVLGDVEFEEPNRHKGVTNKIKIVRFLSDDEVLSMIDSNYNSGNNNSGNRNSGNFNSGYYNSGDSNSGNYNSGDYNSGYRNSGDYNSGYNNSGYNNSGNRNSGYYNSGNKNSGYYNSGNRNSGDNNSGNWNKSNDNTGHFNTKEQLYIDVFNKPCLKTDWDNAVKPNFIYFELIAGKSYKECFVESYDNAALEDKLKILKLPNFDKDVFFEISGIDVSELM